MEELRGTFPQLHGPLPFGQFRECGPWRYCLTVERRLLAPGLACGQETHTAILQPLEKCSSPNTLNTLRLRYTAQPVNAV
jgi:hypothetical protein